MPHELDYRTDERGERGASMVSVLETPWHREGVVLEQAPDLDRALKLAGLDFEVAKVPHYVEVPCLELDGRWEGDEIIGERRHERSGDSFSVVRKDRCEVVGTVGSLWQPLQNREAFEPVRGFLDEGIAVIETAGSLRGGKNVWMLVRFDTEAMLRVASETYPGPGRRQDLLSAEDAFGGGEILPYGLFTNDHSGKAKARVKETAVRVVCANTYDWALGRAEGFDIAVSHVTGVADLYSAATRMLFVGLAGRYLDLAAHRSVLQRCILQERDFARLVLETAVPILHLERKIQRRETAPQTEAALERATAKRSRIRHLWEHGAGHTADHSAWEAWNGLMEWIDHDKDALGGNGGRVQSLYDGTLGYIKRRSLGRLMTFARADRKTRRQMLAMQN